MLNNHIIAFLSFLEYYIIKASVLSQSPHNLLVTIIDFRFLLTSRLMFFGKDLET